MTLKHKPATPSRPQDLIDAPDLQPANRSGRATWDERGNSIWEWQTAPGVFSRDINAQQLEAQLEALEAADLRVVDIEQMSVRPVSGHLHTGTFTSRKRKTTGKSVLEKFLMRLGLPA